MTRTVAVTLFVAVALTSLPAAAAPYWNVYYNPATGGIWMKSDITAHAFYVFTTSGSTLFSSDPAAYRTISRAQLDLFELPLAFGYQSFGVSEGNHGFFIGNVVSPGTPANYLQAGADNSILGNTLVDVSVIPEPNAAIITVIALAGLSALRQCPRRDR